MRGKPHCVLPAGMDPCPPQLRGLLCESFLPSIDPCDVIMASVPGLRAYSNVNVYVLTFLLHLKQSLCPKIDQEENRAEGDEMR